MSVFAPEKSIVPCAWAIAAKARVIQAGAKPRQLDGLVSFIYPNTFVLDNPGTCDVFKLAPFAKSQIA
jgi:hypothetical protein